MNHNKMLMISFGIIVSSSAFAGNFKGTYKLGDGCRNMTMKGLNFGLRANTTATVDDTQGMITIQERIPVSEKTPDEIKLSGYQDGYNAEIRYGFGAFQGGEGSGAFYTSGWMEGDLYVHITRRKAYPTQEAQQKEKLVIKPYALGLILELDKPRSPTTICELIRIGDTQQNFNSAAAVNPVAEVIPGGITQLDIDSDYDYEVVPSGEPVDDQGSMSFMQLWFTGR